MARRKPTGMFIDGVEITHPEHKLFVERGQEHGYELFMFKGKPTTIVPNLITATMQFGVDLTWDYTGLGIMVSPRN